MDAYRLRLDLTSQLTDRKPQGAPLLSHPRSDAGGSGVRVTCRDERLELEHLSGARWIAIAPQRAGWMNLEARAPLRQNFIHCADREDAPSPIEICHITHLQTLPGAVGHPRGQQCIENHAACGRERKRALLRGEPLGRAAELLQVAAVAAEALRAEVVGHSALFDRRETRCEAGGKLRRIALLYAHAHREAI